MGNKKVEAVVVETVRGNVTEEDTGGGEEANMESMLSSFGDGDSDAFVTAEEKEANAALERRRKRKRRLETMEASADAVAVVDTSTATNKALPIKVEIIGKPVVKADQSLMLGNEKNGNGNNGGTSKSGGSGDENSSDSDDSDMFGSPSSEDKARKEKKKQTKKASNSNIKNKNSSKDDDEHKKKTEANSRQDGFDDSDGYYKASIGETMELEVLGGSPSLDESSHNESEVSALELRVLGVIGKGVFSSVLKCSTTTTAAAHGNGIPTTISMASSNSRNNHGLPSEVAIKCIRSNETMSKAALDEMKFLIRLRNSPGIVPLLLPSPAAQNNNNPNYVPPPIDFKGHTVLIFPYLPYNLRDVLQKFGKGVGLSLTAVKNYYFQLLSAATHLQKHRVIHADIKPDNILVTSDFSKVVLADFGSAFESRAAVVQHGDDETEGDAAAAAVAASAAGRAATHEAVTPYLVSRFYRAPEIIMGLQPLTHAIDLWSFAVTAAELFLGKVLLKGANNNDMLYVMMEMLGPFPARLIKSHLLQTKKHPLQAHFSQVQSSFVFKQETVDPVLGRAVHKEISLGGGGGSGSNNNSKTFKPTLQSKLLKAKSPKDTRAQILLFADLLNKCLVPDPSKRISVKVALKHEFFGKAAGTTSTTVATGTK